MSYPLNNNVKDYPYSLEFVDGYLKIENGISGTYCLLASSVALVKDCNSVDTCNSELKRFVPDTLKVWGNAVDCCSDQLTSVSLNPVDFGYETAQELADAINQVQGLEIRNTPQFIGFTDDGKPIFRESFLEDGFTSGDPFVHNRDIDKYLNLQIDSWLPADAETKKELVSNAPGLPFTKFFFGDKERNQIGAVTTDTGYTSIFVVIDYTVF